MADIGVEVVYALPERQVVIALRVCQGSTAREVIAAVSDDGTDKEYAASLLSRLQDLAAHYHDPDGVYTSGKGVLGALVDDLYTALSTASD